MMPRVLRLTMYLAVIPIMWSACVNAGAESAGGTGVISGMVVDAARQPIEGLDLQLVAIAGNGDLGEAVAFRHACGTGESGRFGLEGIPPGRYYLGANLVEPRTATVPRTFYPGTRNRAEAIALEFRAGQNIEGLILVMPDYGAKRKLRIVVLDEAGARVPNAWISPAYQDRDDPAAIAALPSRLQTGPDGVATVDVLANAHYRIVAERYGCVWSLFTGVAIPPGSEPATVLMVLAGKR